MLYTLVGRGLKMNMNEVIVKMDQRMTKIEDTLETIAHNHLSHIEQYTRWTLLGVLISSLASLTVVAITVL